MKKLIFTCRFCGSHHMGYQKYVLCINPAFLQEDGTIIKEDPQFDEEDYLSTCNGYICLDCMRLIEHCGCRIETDAELETYLSLDPQEREKQQKEYERLEGIMFQPPDNNEDLKDFAGEFNEEENL